MHEKAISKLNEEIKQEKDNLYVQVVGEFLIKFIKENINLGEKFMAKDKTIGKSLDAMKKVAEKKKTGNFAMLTPEEGYRAVLNYFDIKTEKVIKTELLEFTPKIDNTVDLKFNLKLEDLL